MTPLRSVLLAMVVLALAAPSAATAATAPPGNSEVDQYTETLPGPSGNNTVDPPANPKPEDSVLPPGTRGDLEKFGPDGAAAAGLAESTAPDAPSGDAQGAAKPSGGGSGGSAAAGGAGDAKGDSAVKGVLEALTGTNGDGLGVFLVLILAAVAAMGIGHVLLRRARQVG